MWLAGKSWQHGMYHAIVKDVDEYNGGTDLMCNISIYIQRKPKKYTVNKLN